MDNELTVTRRSNHATSYIDAWCSGKHRGPGGKIQALTEPDGFPLWVSEVEPGSIHDMRDAINASSPTSRIPQTHDQ
jgi:hypothetical protein